MSRISAVLVHDGGTNYLSGIAGTEAMQADFEKVFAPIKDLDPTYPFTVRKVEGLVGGGGSDHSSFIAANVPGFFWGQRGGRAVYQHTHHTQFDTYDAAIPEYQVHSSLVVALGAFRIADLDHLLSREKLRSERPTFRRRTLGVELDDLTVADVDDDSVGQKIGIKAGDVIVKIDGTKVADRSDVTDSIRDGGPKQVVTILRNGKEIELKIDWEPAARRFVFSGSVGFCSRLGEREVLPSCLIRRYRFRRRRGSSRRRRDRRGPRSPGPGPRCAGYRRTSGQYPPRRSRRRERSPALPATRSA